jgi:PD-(D/E)XK nuclease superfamily
VRVVLPHWSATKFMLYDQCPGEFKSRYVDGVALEPSEALCFGKAVHMGLEAHFNGQDGERAFRAAWKSMSQEELHGMVDPRLTGMGLTLIDKVVALDLHGVPERGFSLDTNAELGAPIIGALDLYDADSNTVYDFKTSRGNWSQDRAQREVWQPLLYTYALWSETDCDLPAFEYIVLNRASGQLNRFRREWTSDEWLAEMNAAWVRMCEVSVAVGQGHLECHGKHGLCPECGERWGHEHVCDERIYRRRVTLSGRRTA